MVAAHREEHPTLPEQQDHHHGGEPGERAAPDERFEQPACGRPVDHVDPGHEPHAAYVAQQVRPACEVAQPVKEVGAGGEGALREAPVLEHVEHRVAGSGCGGEPLRPSSGSCACSHATPQGRTLPTCCPLVCAQPQQHASAVKRPKH